MGAPSTGKSTLCEALASKFSTLYMPEYGKIYWQKYQKDRRLTMEQLEEIAEGHHQLEDEMTQQAKKYLFVDTNAITTYMFAIDYFGEASPRLTELARQAESRYDYYFLCDTDIPYVASWERSGEQHRKWFQEVTIEDLKQRKINYTVVSGDLKTRVSFISSFISELKGSLL